MGDRARKGGLMACEPRCCCPRRPLPSPPIACCRADGPILGYQTTSAAPATKQHAIRGRRAANLVLRVTVSPAARHAQPGSRCRFDLPFAAGRMPGIRC
ncbi:hypothetical protein VFPFJ_01930 [Purpureocillium lilacinum]|uniref:Uncharacterized protein n=1 Tax=Purpureocillium lilacinum TaxID=33203 RepID=A0A179HTL5_PURLI|nr:hypothetical protein VFPFJ_01930 [Purpureocillium lilacinum]OAQ92769.1 hypothetical protein VFPFJ_01930 [Purpureocillium lilacinum]